MNRRNFLKNSGLGSLPVVTGLTALSFQQDPGQGQPKAPHQGHSDPDVSRSAVRPSDAPLPPSINFVQETSHVFRDEADAAEAVFGKRLIPLAKGRHYFTTGELQAEGDYIDKEEYFKTSLG
ncbi:MAG TPA: hypothetical protein VNS58_28450 [Puia sp.]|nr:hypothetical protein [Puia sp.]